MARQTKKQAVEERTCPGGQAQQRLAARKGATRKGAETRRRRKLEAALKAPEVRQKYDALKEHEAKLVAETRKMLKAEAAAEQRAETPEPAATAPQAAKAEKPQPQGADGQANRPERAVAQTGRAVSAMATVALRGEQAVRFRGLAVARGVSLARLLVQMIDAFEVYQP